jgi:hypothetical protein
MDSESLVEYLVFWCISRVKEIGVDGSGSGMEEYSLLFGRGK